MLRSATTLAMLLLATVWSHAQVEVRGAFLADSLRIGEVIPFSLTARYPRELNLLFPDSTFAYAPFEFSSKRFFPTKTNGPISTDSVVYYLSSYEIDSLQILTLPVFQIHPGDCTSYYSTPDTIAFKHLVASVPDSVAAPQLPLKTQTSYLNVKWLFNYPLWVMISLALVLLVIIAWVIWGKRIRQYFQIRSLQRRHQDFLNRFRQAVDRVGSNFSAQHAEQALVVWKNYMESLESKPFTKLTSKEIVQAENDPQLISTLGKVDRMVYANITADTTAFIHLQQFTEQRFSQKLESFKS